MILPWRRTAARIDGLHEELARMRDAIERIEKRNRQRDQLLAEFREELGKLEISVGKLAYRVTQLHRKAMKGAKHDRTC